MFEECNEPFAPAGSSSIAVGGRYDNAEDAPYNLLLGSSRSALYLTIMRKYPERLMVLRERSELGSANKPR